MKFDKELVLKNQFWFLLGGFSVLWLIGFIMLWMNSASAIEEKQKLVDGADKALKNGVAYTSPKNPNTFLEPWNKFGKRFHDHKEVVWKDAWESAENPDFLAELRPAAAGRDLG